MFFSEQIYTLNSFNKFNGKFPAKYLIIVALDINNFLYPWTFKAFSLAIWVTLAKGTDDCCLPPSEIFTKGGHSHTELEHGFGLRCIHIL